MQPGTPTFHAEAIPRVLLGPPAASYRVTSEDHGGLGVSAFAGAKCPAREGAPRDPTQDGGEQWEATVSQRQTVAENHVQTTGYFLWENWVQEEGGRGPNLHTPGWPKDAGTQMLAFGASVVTGLVWRHQGTRQWEHRTFEELVLHSDSETGSRCTSVSAPSSSGFSATF